MWDHTTHMHTHTVLSQHHNAEFMHNYIKHTKKYKQYKQHWGLHWQGVAAMYNHVFLSFFESLWRKTPVRIELLSPLQSWKLEFPCLPAPRNCLLELCTDESLSFCPVVNPQAGSDSATASGQIQHCGDTERSEFPAPWDPGPCRPSWPCSHWTLLLETARAVQRLYGGFVLYKSVFCKIEPLKDSFG